VTVTLTLTYSTTIGIAVTASDLVSVTVPHRFANDNECYYNKLSLSL